MYENIMCSQRNRSSTSLHSPFILVYIYFIYLKTHNDITTNNKVTLALSMLRNSEKKNPGSRCDFSIRRRDLKTIKNTLGWVTCSVNWRQDNSCKSSWCCRLNLKLSSLRITDCSSWVLIEWHQLKLYICFFLLLLQYVMSLW